jgi:hypothetical protein
MRVELSLEDLQLLIETIAQRQDKALKESGGAATEWVLGDETYYLHELRTRLESAQDLGLVADSLIRDLKAGARRASGK